MGSPLGHFGRRDVLQSTIKVTKAGDGLSASVAIEDDQTFDIGDKVFVLLECEVGPIAFVPIPKTDALSQQHTFVTETATIVDAEFAAERLAAQRERIVLAQEAAKGVQRLDMSGDGDPDDAGE